MEVPINSREQEIGGGAECATFISGSQWAALFVAGTVISGAPKSQ